MEIGAWPDWVSALANVGVAGAAIVAVRQGIEGLTAWRREAVGRRRIELAEEVLADFYEVRDVLRWVRSPAAYGHESEGRPGRDQESEHTRHHRDTFYVPLKRLTDHAEFFAKMDARRYRVAANFGKDAAEPYDEIREIRAKISISAQALMRLDPAIDDNRTAIRREKLEEDVWEGNGADDVLASTIDEIVRKVEARFLPEFSYGAART